MSSSTIKPSNPKMPNFIESPTASELATITSSTVGASLRPDSASSVPRNECGMGTVAEHREDRRSIGRGRDCAQQHRNPERQSEDIVPEKSHQADADPDAKRGQQRRQDGRGPDVAPLGGEAALGQDHHERGKPECLRKIGIVEGDSDTGFAHHHAETEEQQQ